MKPKPLPPVEYLRECLCYEHGTGKLFWKKRPREHFKNDARWKHQNARHGGAEIACVSAKGYTVLRLDGELYYAHRIIWKLEKGTEPPDELDHRDRCGTNGRIGNLRVATRSQQLMNRRPRSENTGIYFHKASGLWAASVQVDKKKFSLGYFSTKEAAQVARKRGEQYFYGEFAP